MESRANVVPNAQFLVWMPSCGTADVAMLEGDLVLVLPLVLVLERGKASEQANEQGVAAS